MLIAFVVLKLEGVEIDPPHGVTGSRNSQGGIGLKTRLCQLLVANLQTW